MNRKSLAVLMRARMRASPNQGQHQQQQLSPHSPTLPNDLHSPDWRENSGNSDEHPKITFSDVKDWMHASVSIPTDKTESVDASLDDFSQGYLSLLKEGRRELLLVLARNYDVNRARVRELMQQYISLDTPHSSASVDQESEGVKEDGMLAAFYRTERNLRDALKPLYSLFFERLNAYPGGLKLLTILRADLLSFLAEENGPSLRALDSYLKEKLISWLSPAALELHQITWDDSASLLEKIVAYEAVHPIRNLLDLKRRLGVGRRCFGYFHPAIPGEPLIFIEVALLKDVAKSIQEVLWDNPPVPECKATCALFYSISSTQPGLSGINLGKFLIKRVIELVRRDMPIVTTFATLSPVPGYMQWLLSKLASQLNLAKTETVDKSDVQQARLGSAFREEILLPEEETTLVNTFGEHTTGEGGLEIMYRLLASANIEWTKSEHLLAAFRPPLMRLCARYLVKEKKRGKALDAVANFHLRNGAMLERINWMADESDKGIQQSGGIMVNYMYRLDKIEECAQSYFSTGHIHASDNILQLSGE